MRHSEQKVALDSEYREANEDDYVRPVTQSDVNGWRRNLGDFAKRRSTTVRVNRISLSWPEYAAT